MLAASDVDGPPPTFSLVSNGARGTAVVTNAETGAFTYTPVANANGDDSFTFQASDGSLAGNVATVAISIAPVNDPPTAANGALAVEAGTSAGGALSATDVDGPALTYTIVANGAKGTAILTNASTGAYTYAANSSTSGTDTFTFRAGDGALDSNIATVTVTIAPQEPPGPSVVLFGRVTDRATGQPLAGATVFRHGATNGFLVATTDTNGRYTIDGSQVPTTSGPLTFQAPGHFVVTTSYNITTIPATVDVSLLGAPPVLQGTVRDSITGQPIASAACSRASPAALGARWGPRPTQRRLRV